MENKSPNAGLLQIVVALFFALIMIAGAKLLPEGGLKENWVFIMIAAYMAVSGVVLSLTGRKRC